MVVPGNAVGASHCAPPRAGGNLSSVQAVELVFAIVWAAFWIYWLLAAFSMKRGHVPWARELRIRGLIVVLAIVLIRFGAFGGHGLNTDPWRAGLGLVLFALGLGSRSGRECISGATGARRCRRRTTRSW
jgi:hypothetical protein